MAQSVIINGERHVRSVAMPNKTLCHQVIPNTPETNETGGPLCEQCRNVVLMAALGLHSSS